MRYLLLLTLSFFSIKVMSQITYNPTVDRQNMSLKKFQIEKVEITPDETIVSLYIVGGSSGEWMSISSNTTLMASDGYNRITLPIRSLTDHGTPRLFNQRYSMPGRKKESHLDMHFDRIPSGYTILTIRENTSGEWVWQGIHITNPIAETPHKYLTESEIKTMISNSSDGICGIYEGIDQQGYKLACIKENNDYSLIFLGVKNNNGRWKVGDVKAELRPSASAGLFKATWYMADKSKNDDAYLVFDGTSMKTYVANEETNYLKMYPTATSGSGIAATGSSWSGTGFALNNGYIATNYHVVENANTITVQGVRGNANEKYSASIIATDKVNDLALIQIKDSRFSGFGQIPYRVKTSTSDVGEDIFVLGYPLITTMGNEIKLTTGVISSKTGFMGDVALYQISAPIQPGNSGGPLFDNQGNLIGIVNAKHKGAENVGYAIKASYLNNLVESVTNNSILPSNNTVSSLNLTNKVKSLEKYVFMIVCTN
jgi:S1-C subfamily serine protease